MNTQPALTRDAVVDALIAQLALRRRQTTAYHQLAKRVLGGDARERRAQIVPMSIAARAKTAA